MYYNYTTQAKIKRTMSTIIDVNTLRLNTPFAQIMGTWDLPFFIINDVITQHTYVSYLQQQPCQH